MVALQQAKEVANEAERRLEKAQLTREEISASRRTYQPVSSSVMLGWVRGDVCVNAGVH